MRKFDQVEVETIQGLIHYNDAVHRVMIAEGGDESLLIIDSPPLHQVEAQNIAAAYQTFRNLLCVQEDTMVTIQAIRRQVDSLDALLLVNICSLEGVLERSH